MKPITLEKLKEIYLECGLAIAEQCVDQAASQQSRESLLGLYDQIDLWEAAENLAYNP